jgi:dynein heavy chain, axonemal
VLLYIFGSDWQQLERVVNQMQVLDDNKKLCLVSGEIIQLSGSMTMMFEVEDLAVASPATVSRCGMVYMEPTSLGFEPLLQTWLDTQQTSPLRDHCSLLRKMFNALVPHMIRFVHRGAIHETITSVHHNLAMSTFKVMDAMMHGLLSQLTEHPEAAARIAAAVPGLMLFSVVWSVGATCDKASRAAFDAELRATVQKAG